MDSSSVSLGVAAAAGLLSFLSPCVLPLMPAYLTVVSGASLAELQDADLASGGLRRRVMANSVAFVLGFTMIFMMLGASATFAGQFLSQLRGNFFGLPIGIGQVAGILIIVMGLHVAGWLPITALYRVWQMDVKPSNVSLAGSFAVGAGFAFGWSPCIGPILGTILTLAAGQDTVFKGMIMLAAYSAGLAIPFLISGWSAELLLRLMGRMRQHFHKLEIASGLLLIAVGLAILTGYWANLNAWMSGAMGGLTTWVLDAEEALLR